MSEQVEIVASVASSLASFSGSHSWPQWECVGGCGLFTALQPYRLVSESAWATARYICQMLRAHFDLLELQEVLSVQVDAEGVLWMLRSV